MLIHHIYGGLAIFLIFCDHQDTASESQEMEICVGGPLLTQKISKALWYNNIHIPKYGRKYCGNYPYLWS